MSSQTSSFPAVPFSITKPAQSLRLLELPNELLELLSSDEKPETLHLKSAPPPSTRTGNQSKDHFLHLCTYDKVWAIRQVSTSNSLYITCPNVDNTTTGVTAISQPTSSLELIPVSATIPDAEKAVRAVLPVYDVPSDDVHTPTSQSHQSIFSLLANIPLPDTVLKSAICNLFVFDIPNAKNTNSVGEVAREPAYIPTPHLLLTSWELFYTHLLSTPNHPAQLASESRSSGTLDSDDPDVPNTNISETLDSLARSEGVVYASVAKAIMDRFADRDIVNAVAAEIQSRSDQGRDERTKGALKTEELTIWIGYLIIQCASKTESGISDAISHGMSEGIPEQKLLETWQNIIPRQWWGYCDVDALLGYESEWGSGRVQRRESDSASALEDGKGKGWGKGEGRVYFVPTQRASEGQGGGAEGGGGGASAGGVAATDKKASTATATAGKRNWHERFNRERMGGR